MALRPLFLALLLMVAALAGCSDAPPADGEQPTSTSASSSSTTRSSSASASTTTSSSATGTEAPSNGGPAIAAFTANLTGLNVSFTLEATDPDGDALSFELSFGDGTSNATGPLPSPALNHTFAAAGNYTATLTVTDGTDVDNRTLALEVKATAVPGKPEQAFSCTVDAPAVVVSVSGLPIAFGFCEFTTTSAETVLVVAAPAAGCTIRLDENTGDTTAGPVVEEGSTNPPGQYGMRCDVQGPSTGGDGSITIRET